MSLHLLDADTIIDYTANFLTTKSFIDALVAAQQTLCTCAVVLAEVYTGLRPEHAVRGEELLSSFLFLPTSDDAGRQAGRWRYAYARRGIQLSTTDMLIAATALEHGARLVTANLKDYPMPEIDLLPLPRARRNGSV
jgi:tRNA(fMet)-specific endonuclease VapC